MMAETQQQREQDCPDFLISYAGLDRAWAEWMAYTLEAEGYRTHLEAWDVRPEENRVGAMDKATRHAERTLVVLSAVYLADARIVEWTIAFLRDPAGKDGQVMLVRIDHCAVSGVLSQLSCIDLVDLSEQEARETLLAGVKRDRAKIDALTKKEGQRRKTKTVKIFYCYARKDKVLRDELEKHLIALERSDQVITWHDRKILPGAEWKHEISNQLDTSDIILLLMSPNFIQSDYCYGIEMQRALERHRAGAVHVIPIILRPCDWKAMPLHALQALPEDGKPISKWRNRDDAFQDVVKGIRQVIDALYSAPSHREESEREVPYREMILCPYCLTLQELGQITTRCTNLKCGQELPYRYREKARTGKVTCLGTFGLSSHGKTAFLASLMQSALAVYKIAPGSYFYAFDSDTQKKLHEWSERYRNGRVKMPTTSPVELPRPLLVMSKNFPVGHPNILVAYDLAGEALELVGTQPAYVRALSKVNTAWYIISLDDLVNHNDAGYSIDSLFNIYQNAMAELHISTKGKNMLVVYTKADLLLGAWGLEPLPPEVIEYLANDPYDQLPKKQASKLPAFDEDAYFAEMTRISDRLREYTRDFVDGGGAFVNMVRDAGMQVYFTINSAYGRPLDANNSTLGMPVHSIRVLDALIWAIKLNSPPIDLNRK
jgi:hypothetical protein